MTVDINEGKKAEGQPEFLAQLQAILNVLPAYTWYSAPVRRPHLREQRTGDYLGFPKDHPHVSASTLAQSGTTGSRCCIRTTKEKHANSGQTVCARARPVSIVIEFVALKETTAGSSLALSRSGPAMELYCCGLGRLWILKSSNPQSKPFGKANTSSAKSSKQYQASSGQRRPTAN